MIKRPIRNVVLPAMILFALMWCMVGCVYVPWFEHRVDSGPNVRAMVGTADTDKPIRPYHVTRSQVIAMLGESPWYSEDGTALGYVSRTAHGTWFWPLCFYGVNADARSYVVRLEFDKDGVLKRFDWQSVEYRYLAFKLGPQGSGNASPDEEAIEQLNRSGPILVSREHGTDNTPATQRTSH